MDLIKLKYFIAAAELLNFSKAAEACNITQTAIGKYINKLENEIGCSLFYRTNKGVSLTEAGEKFYLGVKEITGQYEDLLKQIENETDKLLRIGIAGDYLPINFLRKYKVMNRDISLEVEFKDKDQLINMLERGSIDAMIIPDVTMLSENTVGIEKVEIGAAHDVICCSQESVIKYGSVGKVIENLPLITKAVESEYHEYCRDNLKSIYNSTFSDVRVVDTVSNQTTLIALGQGFAIMPKEEMTAIEDMYMEGLGERFTEILLLVYMSKNKNQSLRDLLKFVSKSNSDGESLFE
ncbi:MAG: LysR family transcriptional regulator [Mogibacterium diversum]|nr:LysR family transcriptional regulator [Mogibacterium diversum]